MKIARGLTLTGIVIGSYALGAEGTAAGCEYMARTQGTLYTTPAYRDGAELARDFRDISGVIAAAEFAGAAAISLTIRKQNYDVFVESSM